MSDELSTKDIDGMGSGQNLIEIIDVSIVVPTYQEAENIVELSSRVDQTLSQHNIAYELIIVDDNSRDGTDRIVAEVSGNGHPIRLFTRYHEKDLSTAVIFGFEKARGKVLVCMDADLSHPPETIPQMVDELNRNKTEFVIGSRYVPGAGTDDKWGVFRWVNSKVATLMARPFTSVKDPMSGFFALPRNVYTRSQKLQPIGYKIGMELIVKCACRKIAEIPIHFENRKRGSSKLNLKEQIKYIQHIKRLADFKYGNFSHILQFCFVGATGMIWDLILYKVLLDIALPLSMARALAIWAAMSWNFWCNRRLTFSYSRPQKFGFQYMRFIASCAVGATISWIISVFLPTLVAYFGQHVFLAAVIGIFFGTLTNFTLSRWWVFGEK